MPYFNKNNFINIDVTHMGMHILGQPGVFVTYKIWLLCIINIEILCPLRLLKQHPHTARNTPMIIWYTLIHALIKFCVDKPWRAALWASIQINVCHSDLIMLVTLILQSFLELSPVNTCVLLFIFRERFPIILLAQTP